MKFVSTVAAFINPLFLLACAGSTTESIPFPPTPFVEARFAMVPATPLATISEGPSSSHSPTLSDTPMPLPSSIVTPITPPTLLLTPSHLTMTVVTKTIVPDGQIRLEEAPVTRASPRTETSKPQSLFADLPNEVTVEQLSDGSYVCRPAGAGPFPAVLYNHGGLGTIVGGDLPGTCRSLAEAGYLAHSKKRQETRQLTGHLEEVLDGLKQLRSHPDADASRVGVMGFSRGGLLTLQAAIAQPENIHAVVLMAPAHGKSAMERTLRQVSPIDDPVRVFVSENDQTQANHVQISHDVEDALSAAGKDVDLTIYPPYGDDGHKLFFLVQEPYWSDLIDFFDEVLG